MDANDAGSCLTLTYQHVFSFARHWDAVKRARATHQEVEKAAIRVVTNHYTRRLGYDVKSVEREDRGWDLEAVFRQSKHYLEVKGLSGDGTAVELTPNEYKAMREKWSQFKVCVVTNALTRRRTLRVFSCAKDRGGWRDADGDVLTIERMSGARLHY